MPTREEWIEEFSKKNSSKDKIRTVDKSTNIIQGRK